MPDEGLGAQNASLLLMIHQHQPTALSNCCRCCVQVGDKFVLNCLGEKSADPIMKHFLKRFAAGEDRFQVS
jgi:hypothetical protein